jgi:hypothetical protein
MPVHRCRRHLAADGVGQLLLAQVGHRLGHHRLDLFLPALVGAGDQLVGGPGLVLGLAAADDLQPHREANLVGAAVLGRTHAQLLDLLADALGVVAPAAN